MITIILRTLILYCFVILGIRLMGKRQIGDMQPNELVITLLISEIAAIPLQDTNQPVIDGIVAIFILIILEILMSIISLKSLTIRKFFSGNSVVIIKDGEIDQNAMKKVRLSVTELIELLRGQDVFDISTVAYAVLEINGDLSVLLKTEKQTVTCEDMNINKKNEGLPLPVISDGKIVKESIKSLGITEDKIYKKIKSKKLEISEVFLMTIDRYDNINIIKKRSKN